MQGLCPKLQLGRFGNAEIFVYGEIQICNTRLSHRRYLIRLNFRCDLLQEERIVFTNRAPHKGEPKQFPDEEDIAHSRTYALIVFMPRTATAPPAVLIGGTTAQSTKAAGEFLSDRKNFENTLRSTGIDPTRPPCFFELLIRSNNFVSGAILPEVAAWRVKSYREP